MDIRYMARSPIFSPRGNLSDKLQIEIIINIKCSLNFFGDLLCHPILFLRLTNNEIDRTEVNTSEHVQENLWNFRILVCDSCS